MGIAFSRSTAHWSYSGFDRFRQRLSLAIGVDRDAANDAIRDGGMAAWNKVWDAVHDPIKDLLLHSDCDGELTPEQCAVIAPRLRQLVAAWPAHDMDKREALLLARGMDTCRKRGENLEFL